MEVILVIAFIAFVAFLIGKGQQKPYQEVKNMTDGELLVYKQQFEQRASLALKAGKMDKYNELYSRIKDFDQELNKRSEPHAMSSQDEEDLAFLIGKHVEMVGILMHTKGLTEEEASNLIEEKYQSLLTEHMSSGLDRDQAASEALKGLINFVYQE